MTDIQGLRLGILQHTQLHQLRREPGMAETVEELVPTDPLLQVVTEEGEGDRVTVPQKQGVQVPTVN